MSGRRHYSRYPAGCGFRVRTTTSGPFGARAWILCVIAILCTSGLSATAAEQVAVLIEKGASTYRQTAQGFRTSFGDAIEPHEIDIDESGRMSGAALESLRVQPPRLIIAIGARAIHAALQRMPKVPILYCLPFSMPQDELAGASVGGMVLDADPLRQFESIRRLLPHLRRVGVVYDDLSPNRSWKQALPALGAAQVVQRIARTPQEAQRAIQELFSTTLRPGDAYWLVWDSVSTNPANFRTLVELSLRNKVALIVPARPFVEAGALVSVGANYEQAGRQLAAMAHKVLSGEANAADFRSVRPEELVITVNGEIARQLGVIIPMDLRADVLAATESGKAP